MRRLTVVVLAGLLTLGALDPPGQAPRIALVLDVSASMSEPTADGVPKIEAARQAVTTILRFFAEANPIPRVTFITFSDDPRVLYPLSNNMDAIGQAVDELPGSLRGGTNIGAALQEAIHQLEGHPDGYIVLITDGAPTQGLTAAQIIAGPAREAREKGHCFYTLGLGDYDAGFLEQLRHVSSCPYADQVLGADAAPRLVCAFTAAAYGASPPISRTDADTLISIAVVVVVVLGVGLAVWAVERFRPRPGPLQPAAVGAYLVDLSTGTSFALCAGEGEVTSIGRAADCTIPLNDPAIEPRHTVIRYRQGRYYLQNQADLRRTALNDLPIEAAPLVNGDRITIGSTTFQFRQEG